MDFDLSEEQRLLKESLDRLIGDRYAFEQRKSYAQSLEGWSGELWAQFAELGLLGLPFAEEYGGSSGGPVETMIAMEAFGRALVLEPYLATIVLGGGFLRHGASAEQCTALIPKIADGSLTFAFAHTERQSRYDLHDIATRAVRDGAGWVLDGEKGVVIHGDTADRLIVTARVGGGRRDREGIAAFIVDGQAAGVSRRGYPTQDGMRAAEVTLAGVRVGPENVLGEPGAALLLVERVVDEAIAALCAEAVGAMAVMHELTVDYLKTRRQFGREIGTFQILQHRAVDMLIALEQARSMAMFATMMAADENAAERRNAVGAAKVQIGRSGKFIGQQAIQLHGGIGMTMEYKVGHYFKRVTMIDRMFGDADHHLRELARRGGGRAAA
ncbi:MAG: acyl-CoA dehydrogenase family protein [Alphaproteobacteria bacterium]|nr:acyl-CoA dehydrogenase family protein [Alphaproteobacteria bacterium]